MKVDIFVQMSNCLLDGLQLQQQGPPAENFSQNSLYSVVLRPVLGAWLFAGTSNTSRSHDCRSFSHRSMPGRSVDDASSSIASMSGDLPFTQDQAHKLNNIFPFLRHIHAHSASVLGYNFHLQPAQQAGRCFLLRHHDGSMHVLFLHRTTSHI